MNLADFASEVQTAQHRVEALRQRAHAGLQHETMAEALEELQTSLEELRVAEEELHAQNEELAAVHAEVEAQRQRYLDLFEFAPDGYLVTDMNGVIREANRAAASLLGAATESLLGKPLAAFIPPPERPDFRAGLLRLCEIRRVEEWELHVKPREGALFDAGMRIDCIRDRDGEPVGLRWMLRDITGRKRAEEQTREMNVQLEARVAERTAQLEAASQVKEELLMREYAALERLAFLSEAGSRLAASLDLETALDTAAHLAVPFLADWCILDVEEPGGAGWRVAAAHTDPRKEGLLYEMRRTYPPAAKAGHPLLQVLQTGKALFWPEAPVSTRMPGIQNREHLQMLRAAGLRSCMVVPLVVRERTIGALTFVVNGSGRRYHDFDLQLAEDLARRVALAIDNARLYSAAYAEIQERQRAEKESAQKQARIAELNRQLQQAMVETHHRVKNSLQIIAAIVDMQIGEGQEMIPISEFKRLSAHIRTLASVHDLLTRQTKGGETAHSLSVRAALERLLAMMQASVEPAHITAVLDDLRISVRQGTSLVIVAHELISNAVKHGGSAVTLRFTCRNGEGALEVLDDGPGFPEGFDPAASASTGLDLVENLSRLDLNGQVRYTNRPEGGGRVVVSFPRQDS
jgi:PAS domain S-box-containing protein